MEHNALASCALVLGARVIVLQGGLWASHL